MPDFIRQAWALIHTAVAAAVDPLLIAHRDYIFTQYLTLPMDF